MATKGPRAGWLDRLIEVRTAERRALALERARRIMETIEQVGVDAVVIGSLASGRFRSHSDIDILVRGNMDGTTHARVESAVARLLRGAGLPYDLISNSGAGEGARP